MKEPGQYKMKTIAIMKNLSTFFLTLLLIASSFQSSAQVLKKLQEQLGGKNIVVEDEYNFDLEVTFDMTTMVKGKPSKVEYTSWYSNGGKYMANQITSIEQGSEKGQVPMEMVIIMDFENEAMVMLMKQQKMAQTMSMGDIKESMQQPENDPSNFKKTGITKKILGYNCYEYAYDGPDMSGTFWFTDELDYDMEGFYKAMNVGGNKKNKNQFTIPQMKNGFMMALNMKPKDSNRKKGVQDVNMVVTAVKKADNYVDMTGYQKIGGLGMMGNR